MSSDIDMIDMCLVNDTVKLPQFPPYFCDFSCTKTCQSCPALNIIRFLTAFLALSESPDQCLFTEHVTQEWKRAKKRNIYCKRLQSGKLDGCFVILILCARNLWGWLLHEEASISRSYPFWQSTSIFGNSCRDGHCESTKIREILEKLTHV